MSRPALEVSFLLGSGVSIPADFPSVAAITSLVLTAPDVYQHTDRRYIFSDDPQPCLADTRPAVEHVQAFLRDLRARAEAYYLLSGDEFRFINYEDLAALAVQIEWSETGEWDNPALGPLISALRESYGYELMALSSEATRYIRDVVTDALGRGDNMRGNHLSFLIDAVQDVVVRQCSIFTLNHDVLVESAFEANEIPYSDGTEPFGPNCRMWSASAVERHPGPRLYKLHGSVAWHEAEDQSGRRWVITGDDPDHAEALDGRRLSRIDGPLILSGTHAKVFNYVQGIFADLFFAFREHLRGARVVVVCGYGFGDKFINTLLVEWLNRGSSRLVVIHGEPGHLRRHARPAITREWDRLVDAGQLHVIPRWAQNVAWDQIRPLAVV